MVVHQMQAKIRCHTIAFRGANSTQAVLVKSIDSEVSISILKCRLKLIFMIFAPTPFACSNTSPHQNAATTCTEVNFFFSVWFLQHDEIMHWVYIYKHIHEAISNIPNQLCLKKVQFLPLESKDTDNSRYT
jgi:hypothetical protein